MLNVNVFNLREQHSIWIVWFHIKGSSDLIIRYCKKLKLSLHNDRPGRRVNNAVRLLSRVNVIIIYLHYYDVIMPLTQSLVFKLFRRDCNIFCLVKSLFFTLWKVQRHTYVLVWKTGVRNVITSETHWITMHNRNMYTHTYIYIYIYIHTQTNMLVHVNSKTRCFTSPEKKQICVLLRPCHPGVSSSQGALSVLTCTEWPQQLISGQFSFHPVMSSLLVLVKMEDWKQWWQLYVFKGKGRDGLSVIRHLDCASFLMRIAFVGPNVSVNTDQECVYSCS